MKTLAQESGSDAERSAERFLVGHGLEILARNYRTRIGEVDLIARDGRTVVFVEVRLRSSARFGDAAASVDGRKQSRIVAAARHYLSHLKVEPFCRFDVVTLDGGKTAWLRGAFDATG